MTAPEIEACVERIEKRLKAEVPTVSNLFVKPQTTGTWERRRREIAAASRELPGELPGELQGEEP
jgi:divalent metal cation (Fe/Co/Zn/Cd) transporter